MSGKSSITQIVVSDIHLGNPRTTTEYIIGNLRKYIPLEDNLVSVDVIQIVGDLFDEGLLLSDSNVELIEDWITDLLMACRHYDVQLRILEGTPSHDRKQSKRFIYLNKRYNIGCDVLYFDKPTIEYNEKLNIHSLYIPDEYHSSAAETYVCVKDLLTENNLTSVDFGFFHGFFEHQVPSHHDHHKSTDYRDIVKQAIFCGHDHYPSILNNFVFVQGSFDRLRFNEEGDKGYYVVNSTNNPQDLSVRFVVNESAKIYNTVDVKGKTAENALQSVLEHIKDLPEDSWVRLETDNLIEHSSVEKTLKETFPQFNWKRKVVTGKEQVAIDKPSFSLQPLNNNTLPSLIEERLIGQGCSPEVIEGVKLRLLQYQQTF